MTAIQMRTKLLSYVPGWLKKGDGERYMWAAGLLADAMLERGMQVVKARFPLVATYTALGAIGRDRRILRGFDESDASYRQRLVEWLDAWKAAGHAYGIMRALAGYLSPYAVRIRVVTNTGEWYTRTTAGVYSHESQGNWDWDGDTASWSRFWVIIYPLATGLWDADLDWGDTDLRWGGVPKRVWGVGSMTPEQRDSIRALVQQWKPAHARCEYIVVAFDGATFDPSAPEPDGTWDVIGTGTPRVKNRLATARYIPGEA